MALEGAVEPDLAFKLWRSIRYRNSFVPIAEGRIQPAGQGSRLVGRLRLNWFVAIFMALWCSGMLVAVIAVAASTRGGRAVPRGLMIVPAGMALFGYLMVQAGFWGEAGRILRVLEQLAADKDEGA